MECKAWGVRNTYKELEVLVREMERRLACRKKKKSRGE